MKKFIYLLFVIIIAFACNNSNSGDDEDFSVPDSVVNKKPLNFAEESLTDVIENLASPVEMATIIKNAKVPFAKNNLCSIDLIDNYTSGYQYAVGLGVYGADLGYINVYSKTSLVLDYIMTIKTLADNIKVGQYFDFNTLKDLALNSDNIDSLTYISVRSFNNIDRFLRENDRGNLSALIIAGAWLEGLYLSTQLIKEKQNKEIAEKIGEQKLMLNDLMLILKNYNNNNFFNFIVTEFGKIKSELDKVKITYEKGEPTSVEQDGILIIVQNETSIIHITEEQLNSIIRVTEEVRNNIVEVNEGEIQ